MIPPTNRQLALALAKQLDEYLAGGRTLLQVGEIEGALNDAEPLRELLESFEDLEFGAAMVAPGQGPEYLSLDGFALVAQQARDEIADRFGI